MTTARRFLLITVLIAALATPALAYNDIVTHPQLTIIATEKSQLYTDGTIMAALGLLPADQQYFLYGARAGSVRYGTNTYPLSAFVGEGAFDEDVGERAVNHFFDPYHDRPANFFGDSFFNPRRSWEWILEENGANIPEQRRSEWDARNYLRRALTFNEGAPAEADLQRRIAMAEMFLSLGHVMHHLQDMAQPQHVRNDMHLDRYPYLPQYDPSRYEAYTAERGPSVEVWAEMAAPNYPGPEEFQRPRDFWTNTFGTGIAQFVNNNFLSKDTNFSIDGSVVSTGDYPSPRPLGAPLDYTPEALFGATGVPAEIQSICSGLFAPNCTMSMYSTLQTQKASTLSIFDQDLRKNNLTVTYSFPFVTTKRAFALNRFNFDAVHPDLINKAVSYSAGFLNYFFRGKFEVMAPETGPYAVVDHAENKGFTKVRVRVMNRSGVALAPGQLRAIAKFHRNGCYQPDLTGEFSVSNGQLVPPQGCTNYHSAEAHVRMTAEEQHGFTIGETKNMTFTFTDPIPLDAQDLILQVLYRGTVGEEVDGFALGAADLSEPTYFTIMNATDMFELNGTAFYDYNEIINKIAEFPYSIIDFSNPKDGKFTVPPDLDVRGGDIRFEVKINGQKVGDIAALPEGRFARIAALVSPFGANLTLIAFGNGFNHTRNYQMPAKIFQYAPELGGYLVSPVDKLRGQFYHHNSVTHYHFYPVAVTPIDKMGPSTRTDKEKLVAVTMAPDPQLTAIAPAPASVLRVAPTENPHDNAPGNADQETKGNKPIKKNKD